MKNKIFKHSINIIYVPFALWIYKLIKVVKILIKITLIKPETL